MKLFFYVIAFCFGFYTAQACQCPVTALNVTELAKYDIIFSGKIVRVQLSGERSQAYFAVSELYKGLVAKDFMLLFNNNDNCKLELVAGDEWIVYANYYQIDNAKLDFCSRSRKFFKNSTQDFFETITGVTYGEELQFLQTKLGLHKPLKENPNRVENRNILPNTNQMIIGFMSSLIGLLFFYWIFNKVFKRQNNNTE